jgi:cation:H+ antiporter
LVYARQIFRFKREQQSAPPETESPTYSEIPTKIVYLRFGMAAAAVVGAGIWLSFIGDEIAETTGWGASFVGSLFLAISTSMPELVVTVAAVRLGAADMAVADILGANMLDVVAILWTDIFYTQGPILAVVSRTHLITAVVTIIMSLLVVAGLNFRRKLKTFGVISWYGPLLIGLYILGAYALFTSGIRPG